MQVYEHSDPDSLTLRSHPWTDARSSSAYRYSDFRARPELIRTSLEDLQPWSAWPATETFYRLLEWLNGHESVLESNDCAFDGPAENTHPGVSKRMQCAGRLMLLYRELARNTSARQIHTLTNSTALALSETDPAFEWGAVGATIVPVRYITLPGPQALQRGQQLMLSFWAWGDDEPEVMANLDRTFRNVSAALQSASDESRGNATPARPAGR